MIYPKFIKENDTIGVSAVSAGNRDKNDRNRMNNAIKKFEDKNFNIRITDNCKYNNNGRSSDAITRARELENLFLDDDVKAIICLAGGDYLVEVLSVLRYDIIWNNPKWIQGYSDPTGLLYTITTNLDIATIYSHNFRVFSMQNWYKSLEDNIEILKGNLIEQTNFEYYEKDKIKEEVEYDMYNLDTKTNIKFINNNKSKISGRLIGGCLDILVNLIGTKYDKTKNFLEKYKEDGFIWYFDICELSLEAITRAMWQLKETGWFNYTNGIIIGRLVNEQSAYDINLKDVLEQINIDLNIPIIYDLDFGHTNPKITIINGALATLNFDNNNMILEMFLN